METSCARCSFAGRAAGEGGASASLAFSYPEPVARRLLRICFGLIWIFDGILQAQASMPLGMAPQVIQPAAATSPPGSSTGELFRDDLELPPDYRARSRRLDPDWHRVWLLTAPGGTGHASAELASLGWGIIVWVSAEAFGGIFARGSPGFSGRPEQWSSTASPGA